MRAAALIFALAATTAHAQFVDGNELFSRMNGNAAQVNNAVGYVMGVADAELGTLWCPPANVTVRQVFDMTKQYLDAVPEKRHESGSAFVLAAVRTTWPCKPKQDTKPASAGKGTML